jgi:hypothetical protein
MTPDQQGSYADTVRWVYEGEMAAERVFHALSARAVDPDVCSKFAALAAIERHTHHSLRPSADRLGIFPEQTALQAVAAQRIAHMETLPWRTFIEGAHERWPAYIARFQQLRDRAPFEDRAAMQTLVAHEVALVEFIRAEFAMQSNTIAILHTYLERAEQSR